MPNIKVYQDDHKRLTTLKGKLTAERGKVAYYQDTVKFLLDNHLEVSDLKRKILTIMEKALYDEEGILGEIREFLLDEHEKRQKS